MRNRPVNIKSKKVMAALAAFALVLFQSASVWAQESEAAPPSLYDRLGGLMPISVVVSDLLDAVVPDPVLNENPAIPAARDHVPTPYLKYQVTAMVCQASGGPCEYTGRDMKSAHVHLNITGAEWERFIELFKGVLAKHGVPEAETAELLAIVDSTKEDIVTAGM